MKVIVWLDATAASSVASLTKKLEKLRGTVAALREKRKEFNEAKKEEENPKKRRTLMRRSLDCTIKIKAHKRTLNKTRFDLSAAKRALKIKEAALKKKEKTKKLKKSGHRTVGDIAKRVDPK